MWTEVPHGPPTPTWASSNPFLPPLTTVNRAPLTPQSLKSPLLRSSCALQENSAASAATAARRETDADAGRKPPAAQGSFPRTFLHKGSLPRVYWTGMYCLWCLQCICSFLSGDELYNHRALLRCGFSLGLSREMVVGLKKSKRRFLDRLIRASMEMFSSVQCKVTSITLRQCGKMSCVNSDDVALSRCHSELGYPKEKHQRFSARERFSMDVPRLKEWNSSTSDNGPPNRVKKMSCRQFSGYSPEDIEFECLIGRGAHGSVHRADLNGHKVAVKIVNICNPDNHEHLASLPEMALLHGIAHPNLVQIFGVHVVPRDSCSVYMDDDSLFETDMFGSESSPLDEDSEGGDCYKSSETWIVMELCEKGSLWEAVQRGDFNIGHRSGPLNYKKILKVGLEIAFAMQHLHELDIIHGDLKAQNVLLYGDPRTGRYIAKVGDFGLCRRPQPHRPDLTTFSMGTVDHMPPETLRDGRIHWATDVYSFAILLVEMMTGRQPYRGMTTPAMMIWVIEGMRPEIPPNCPSAVVNLIKDCWEHDWSRRPSFSVLVGRLIQLLC